MHWGTEKIIEIINLKIDYLKTRKANSKIEKTLVNATKKEERNIPIRKENGKTTQYRVNSNNYKGLFCSKVCKRIWKPLWDRSIIGKYKLSKLITDKVENVK